MDPDWLALWTRVLLKAAHEKVTVNIDGKLVELNPGEFISGRVALSHESGIHESKVRRLLELFKADQQLDTKSASTSASSPGVKGSIFTVLNWHKWQWPDHQLGKPSASTSATNNKKGTSEQSTTTPSFDDGEGAGPNHPSLANVLAFINRHYNSERFSEQEIRVAFKDFEEVRDLHGNWFSFKTKRMIGHWPSAFTDRLRHNREQKERKNEHRKNGGGGIGKNSANRDIGTLNEGKASQYKLNR